MKGEEVDEFKGKVDKWLKNFLSVHLLTCHILEFLKGMEPLHHFPNKVSNNLMT